MRLDDLTPLKMSCTHTHTYNACVHLNTYQKTKNIDMCSAWKTWREKQTKKNEQNKIVNMEVALQLKQLNEIEMLLSKNNETKIKLAELTIWNCTTLVSFVTFACYQIIPMRT